MKKFKRILAVVLAIVMLMATTPVVSAGALSIFSELYYGELVDVTVGKSGKTYSFTPEEDGWYKFYSVGDVDSYASIYKGVTEIAYGDDNAEDGNFVAVAELKAGQKYYVKVNAYLEDGENSASFKVGVEDGIGVVSLEITQMPYNTTVVRDFEYETMDLTGLEVAFTMSDGTIVDWTYEEDLPVGDFYVIYYPDIDEDGNCYVTIECSNLYETIYFTTVDNQIESIEYICDTPIEYYINTNGFYDDFDEQYYYFYEFPEDAQVAVTYKDGTSEVFDFVELIDLGMSFYDEQPDGPWTVGSDNYIFIEYFGVQTTIPVTILPCPFASVTVDRAPDRVYIFGDYDTGYYEDGVYDLYPDDISGLEFTVEYFDGSTRTFTDEDFDTIYSMIDEYEYFISSVKMTEPGTVEACINYLGYEITYDIEVVESHIESIEILTPPDKAEFEDVYYGDYTGAVFKINYKDGTSAQVTADENTMSYYHDGWVICTIQVGEDVVSIFNEYDDVNDVTYDYITCAGVGFVYNGVTYTDRREVKAISVDNFSMSGEGMIFTVEYENGEVEVLTYDVLAYCYQEEYVTEGCARTENGIANFYIESVFDENDEVVGYDIYTLGEVVSVEGYVEPSDYILGDVDNDGVLSVMDATAIQMHLAQIIPLADEQISKGDADGDGVVSVMDATEIQLFKAQLIPSMRGEQ